MKEALNNNSLLKTQTTTAVKKENINEAFFPLYFSIILKNAFNMTVLESHGYPAVYKFFTGAVGNTYQRFDWRGNQNTTIQSIYSFILDILLILIPPSKPNDMEMFRNFKNLKS